MACCDFQFLLSSPSTMALYHYLLTYLTALVFVECIAEDQPPAYIKSLSDLKHLKDRKPPSTKSCDKWSEYQCISQLHGIQCIPESERCDGLYSCKDQSDERHCFLNYANHDFTAKCHNSHGQYTPYALSDIFDHGQDSGEISIAPNDYFECNVQFKNISNVCKLIPFRPQNCTYPRALFLYSSIW